MAVTVTVTISTDANDGYGRRSTGGAWSGISSATYTDNPDSTPELMGLSKAWNGSILFSTSIYMRFDTGAFIPANAIIISANLLLYVLGKQTPADEDYAADFYDFGGTPSVAADWEISSSGDAIATVNTANLTESVVNTIPLTGLSGITRSGEVNAQGFTDHTGIRMSAKTSAEPTVDNWVDFASRDNPTVQEPRLEVTYELASPATFTIEADADDGCGFYTHSSWPPTGGGFTSDDGTELVVARVHSAGTYTLYNGFMRFDTSDIPDDATVLSARLFLDTVDKTTDEGINVAGDWYDFGGEPSVAGDMEVGSSGNAFISLDFSQWGDPTIIPLLNVENINLSGYTGIRLSNGTNTSTPTGSNYIAVASLEHSTGAPPRLEVTYTTGTVDTFAVASAGDDGTGYRETAGAWSGISTGSYTDFSDDSGNALWASKIYTAGDKFEDNAYMRFDTSSIPDGATIVAANLSMFVLDVDETGSDIYDLVGDYYDFGGEPSVAADWTETASPLIVVHDLTDLTEGVVNTLPLIDLSGINKSGYTGIRLTLSGGTPTAANSLQIAAFEHASQEPLLQVIYFEDATEAEQFTVETDADDGSGYYAHSAWPPNSGGAFTARDSTVVRVQKSDDGGGGTYGEVGLLRFDTSTLPDEAVVTGAELVLYIADMIDNDGYSLVGDYYDFGGEATVAGDWVETSSSSVILATTLSDLSSGAVHIIPFTDLDGIDLEGVTGIRLTLSSGTPTAFNLIDIPAVEDTTLPEARLFITYTLAEGAVPLMWHTAIV